MILSWDIGIKNLSYCILSLSEKVEQNIPNNSVVLDNKTFIIHHWDVINLVDKLEEVKKSSNQNLISSFSQRKSIICSHPKCKKVSKYCHNDPQKYLNTGYCLSHFKKIDPKESSNYFYIGDKTPKCLYDNCSRNATYILKEHNYKTYCTIHQKQLIKTCPEIETIKMEKKIKATHINLNHLSSVLFRELDKLPFLQNKEITNVLLENQPVLKNPTMKSMQMFLYAYFILRCNIDNNLDYNVNCYSANQKNKLVKLLDKNQQEIINNELKNIKSKYTRNKKESIRIVEFILKKSKNLEYVEWFKQHKKKDDLADSLLMNIHYIIKNTNE